MNYLLRYGVAVLLLGSALSAGCSAERRQSDAELGLNAQQARGRRLYDQNCIRCHEPYSSRSLQGPSLRGVFKKKYFPSGLPANDDRMTDIVLMGKAKMPSFRPALDNQQLQDLLAYLHTL
jgi:mono/diheme cytochrome c family protein